MFNTHLWLANRYYCDSSIKYPHLCAFHVVLETTLTCVWSTLYYEIRVFWIELRRKRLNFKVCDLAIVLSQTSYDYFWWLCGLPDVHPIFYQPRPLIKSNIIIITFFINWLLYATGIIFGIVEHDPWQKSHQFGQRLSYQEDVIFKYCGGFGQCAGYDNLSDWFNPI